MHRSGGGRRPRRAFLRALAVVSNQQGRGGATEHRIDIEALVEFVAHQVELVEAAAVPGPLAVDVGLQHDAPSSDELRALWLSAGLATHVGLAIFREPERFITASHPSPASPAALAA